MSLGQDYAGVAFGAEFCDRRVPPREVVREAVAWAEARGVEFSLVTPLVREGSLDRVAEWLEGVAGDLGGRECVFNDWGLLRWATQQRLDLRSVVGRVLGRQRRDPRVREMAQGAAPDEADLLRGSAWDDPQTSTVLQELAVTRVELDLLLQGVRRPSLPPGVSLSLCAPWLPVTLSPSCPWAEDALRCQGPCETRSAVRLQHPGDPAELWSRGNATFVRLASKPSLPVLKALGADRLVWAESIPA